MQVVGYSERGIVNALLYEIGYSTEPESLLENLLSRVQFLAAPSSSLSVSDANVLIEQSFSDFGDADALLLFSSADRAVSVFVEAKVGAAWSLEKEFQAFVDGTRSQLSSSNLFTQLYHKVRLVTGLRQGGMPALQEGLEFPKSSTKMLRKIGRNPIVLKAAGRLVEHLDETYYLALLPDRREVLERALENLSEWSPPADVREWDVRNYGFLSWSDVETFCEESGLTDTLNVFGFNEGQIYSKDLGAL